MRCDIKSYADNLSISVDTLKNIDKFDGYIAKLTAYTPVVGGRRIQEVIDGLELLMRVKAAVCEGSTIKPCIEAYSNSDGRQQLLKKLVEALNWPFVNEKPMAVDLFNVASGMNNIILNIALCDLLKDDNFQTRVGRNREEFCDGRGLKRYRLIQSKGSRRIVHRPADGLGEGVTYVYEEDSSGEGFNVRVPVIK